MYCVDDGVILREISHAEGTIEEVSSKCAQLVKRFAHSYSPNRKLSLILGGWSYGGVIAVNVAEILNRDELHLEISGMLLFDSPLRSSTNSRGGDLDSQVDEVPSDSSLSSIRVQQHFRYCTELLQEYYRRPTRATPLLLCPVLDLRAEQSNYVCDPQAVQEITSGHIDQFTTAGTHFTMLFGANAPLSANFIIQFLSSLPTHPSSTSFSSITQ